MPYLGAGSQCKPTVLCSEQGLDVVKWKCSPARFRGGSKCESSVTHSCCTIIYSGKSFSLYLKSGESIADLVLFLVKKQSEVFLT